jgi:predicted O-methyltransferase YrrM
MPTAALNSKRLGFPIGQTGEESNLLKKYARMVDPSHTIIEIGTRNGGSALVLAMNSRSRVVTIDILPDPRLTGQFGYKHIPVLKKHWARYPGGSRIEQVTSTSWEYKHDGSPVGLVFIDGGHEFNQIMRDWNHFKPMVATGGWILVHDYEKFPGVTEFIDKLHHEPDDRAGSIVCFQKKGP